ncbi:S-layer homology domain-containing protein [Candidatus Gracilibacteria bacterium]|nr:S-layer homology domain-containing protein [Candidatus Gracilibacteria bacterium]
MAEERRESISDLVIEDVRLKLVAEPKEFFNFYRYKADVLIGNLGGDLEDGVITVKAGDDGEKIVLKEIDLANGGSYLLEDLEVLVEGEWNFQNVTIEVILHNAEELVRTNNRYETEVYGFSDKLDITKKALEKARLSGLEVWYSDDLKVREENYRESLEDGLVESYGVIEMNGEILAGDDFRKISGFTGKEGFYFLKEEGAESYEFRVSDILHLTNGQILTRGDFAALFLAEVGLKADIPEVEFLSDVALDDEMAAEIYTIYGLGILKDEEGFLRPEKLMTRAEALQAVFDYFDVEFLTEEVVEFSDVEIDSPLQDYLATLVSGENFSAFGEEFRPDDPVSNGFIKFLINEYR